ncbi:MAG: hypothetical protein DCC71_01700 [Proteobacteria bacterium]|nr:MAG: hypothetical protein DCC71_01700 [Pseudomonadota bacterium]
MRVSLRAAALAARAARILLLLGALAAAGAAHAQRIDAPRETTAVTIGGERFVLEVARDPAVQYRGLGGRTSIDPHGGMIFVFQRPQATAFVMRDCPIPIDVAFLDGDGRVVALHEMKPEPPRGPRESAAAYDARLRPYPSGLPVAFAVETAGGRLRQLGVRAGDRIELGRAALLAPRP